MARLGRKRLNFLTTASARMAASSARDSAICAHMAELGPALHSFDVEELITPWDGESGSTNRDRKTGPLIFICAPSPRLGPAAGGTRMKHYPRPADALMDGMRLSEAMSLKFASVDFPHGGGKGAIALPTTAIPSG